MNKRQAKKKERNAICLGGMNYNKSKGRDKEYKRYMTDYIHKHKLFRGFDEEDEMLIEMGIFTEDEIKAKYGLYIHKDKRRYRQLIKQGAEILM